MSQYDPAQRQANKYWLTPILTAALLGGIYLLLRSRLGLGLTAIRDNLTLMGVIAIFMTVRVRQGIWGLLAGRTRLRLFSVGYRVEPAAEAAASGATASQAVSERLWSPRSTVMLNPDKRRQR